MKLLIPLVACIWLLLAACSDAKPKTQPVNETPKALQDKSSSSDISFKKRSPNLLESLYEEQVQQHPELAELEKKLDQLAESRSDSTKSFNTYNGKNESYYNSATSYAGNISDSVLREKMNRLVAASMEKYQVRTQSHTDLLTTLEAKKVSLGDLHSILKLTRTLAVMEKYQGNHLPGTNSITGYINREEEAIRYIDSLLK